jgi:anti-sigma factor RsiW
MTDCPNGDIRDQLPDYVHDRLSAADRALVAAHVASCPFCAAEVELLGAARRAISAAAPRVDTARIVAALPSPPSRAVQRPSIVRTQGGRVTAKRPARRVMAWRMAAAIATVAIGGVSFTVLRDLQRVSTPAVTPSVTPAVVAAPAPSSVAVAPLSAQPRAKGEELAENGVAVPDGGRIGELSDDDVQSLLNDMDQLDGVPDANPQPAVQPVRAGGTL